MPGTSTESTQQRAGPATEQGDEPKLKYAPIIFLVPCETLTETQAKSFEAGKYLYDASSHQTLLLKLTDLQFLLLSTLIGGGDFVNDGEALKVAGPAGIVAALFVVGIVAVMVMDGVSELVQLFPAPNAIFEYVRTFLDEDLAWVVGFAYWYTWVSIYAAQNLAASEHATYYGMPQAWRSIVFFVVVPILTLLINLAPIYVYGWIETIGGVGKMILLVVVSIVLYVIGSQAHFKPMSDGLQSNPDYVLDGSIAICYAIPVVAYSFIGVEAVTVTAYEARSDRDLKWPSQWIAPATFLLYIFFVVSEACNVSWTDARLPPIYSSTGTGRSPTSQSPDTSPMVVIAMLNTGRLHGARILNGCIIFALISASNSSLYIASRTLYGMSFYGNQNWLPGRWFRRAFNTVDARVNVPVGAVVFSFVSFWWLPWLSTHGASRALDSLIEVVAVSSSVCCMITWAALSLVFIRFKYLLDRYSEDLRKDPNFEWLSKRGKKGYLAGTAFCFLQPLPAWAGLIGAIVVVAFSSAAWWSKRATFSKVAAAFLAPVVLTTIWIILKFVRLVVPEGVRSQTVRIRNANDFCKQLHSLRNWRKREQLHPPTYPEDIHDWFRRCILRRPAKGKPTATTREIGLASRSSENDMEMVPMATGAMPADMNGEAYAPVNGEARAPVNAPRLELTPPSPELHPIDPSGGSRL